MKYCRVWSEQRPITGFGAVFAILIRFQKFQPFFKILCIFEP